MVALLKKSSGQRRELMRARERSHKMERELDSLKKELNAAKKELK